MNDTADQAAAREAINLAEALEMQRIAALNTPRLLPAGYCHNPVCGEELGDHSPRLFCGPKCAEQYERYGGVR
ncbi:putative MerR transcription regulator [Xanthomonas phage FoX2]|uniref:Putative MerR transcription regulator n=1 Tax=Xanthomonas phage FoX2 TaxID=2723898 RepID=A0A858NPM1_9CAUD|nr:putative MerR transcription regulator [Xanthomonas phage FoX2]QJB21855.1 putative MerR transcription regulator [Xanthomonas phage FoX2]